MAAGGESAVLPIIQDSFSAIGGRSQSEEARAGRVLFLGGTAYAAAYVAVGVTGFSSWGVLLALAGTALVLRGLQLVARRR